ncbi:MAG: glycosyltransferase family 39 protein [Chloroflexi bacterium]|nr:glycosyltransferase family 39 protein [Chloroflexota bacterium]MCL5275922.1 glycosyltransferase family 39 protein [Chloroflexota bacterium]
MSHNLKRWLDWLPLILIVAFGAYLRLYRIGALPPGLYRDEAYDALDGLNILRGHLAVFFVSNNGREGLFMYLLAAGIAILGRTPEAIRIVSALAGTLTIVAIYATGRSLFSHRIGVLSAAILAITFWHLTLSRIALRAILLPLLLCVFVALAAGTVRSLRNMNATDNKTRWRLLASAFLTGIAFSMTFYTYTAAQFLLVLIIVFGLLVLLLHLVRVEGYSLPSFNAIRIPLLLCVFGASLAGLPLIIWLLRHAPMYYLRAGQVSILNTAVNHGDLLGALWANVIKAAGMWIYQGDRIWRHNLSLRPVFDGSLAIAFVIGMVVSVWQALRGRIPAGRIDWASPTGAFSYRNRPAALFVLLWLGVFLIPTVLAEDTPHYLRAVGALPAACLIAALGMEWALGWLSRRGVLSMYFGRISRVISPPALIAAVLIAIAAYGAYTAYFDVYVRNEMTAYWLEDNNVALARAVNAYTSAHAAQSLWLQDRLANDNPALRFLSPDVEQARVTIVGGGRSISATTDVLLLVDPNHDWTRLRTALPAGSTLTVNEGPLAEADLEATPRRAYIAVSAVHTTSLLASVPAFEQGIQLHQVSLQDAEGRQVIGEQPPVTVALSAFGPSDRSTAVYTVTLGWSTTQPITEDYAVFVHWWRGGQVITQHDGSPAQGYLPMPTWRPGDVIMDQHVLTVPGGLHAGDEVRVGIYRRSDNVRLRILGTGGMPDADSLTIFRISAAQPQ